MADSDEPIVLGTGEAVLQGYRQFLSAWDGDRRTVIYRGTHEAIETLAAQVRSSGFEVSTDYSRPVAELEYEEQSADGTYATYGETWELRGYDVSKKLSSLKALSAFTTQIAEIDQILAGTHPEFKSTKTQAGIQKYIADRSLDNELIQYIALRIAGGDSYLSAGYRIVQTQVVSSQNEQSAIMDNVMRVDTPPLAADAKFSLPTGEWLKKAPQVYALGKGKFKITYEWLWAEEWSNLLYGGNWIPSIG